MTTTTAERTLENRTPIWASEPMQIGKHAWRLIVYSHPLYGRCTDYEFRRRQDDPWRSERKWRTYNSNNGSHAGCPKTLRKLYDKHESTVAALLRS